MILWMLYLIFTGSLVVFFSAFVFAFSSVYGRKTRMFLWLFLLTTFLITTITWLVATYFTGKGVDQVIVYHLRYGLEGAGVGEYFSIIFGAGVLIFLAGWGVFHIGKKWKKGERSPRVWSFFVATFVLLVAIFMSLWSNQIVFDALAFHGAPRDDFDNYYREPWIKSVDGEKPMNVVYIYGESLERTYFDEAKFPGLIKDLRGFQKESVDFSNIKQTPYAGWTIAGMVSSQCGLPLYTTFAYEDIEGGSQKFMPGATCLGDLLVSQGYSLAFFGGADLAFAGKGNFYREHGFDWLEGKVELTGYLKDKTYETSWGLYDDSLLSIAKSRFLELADKGEPFGFFTLTLDTHHPKGNPSAKCKGREYRNDEIDVDGENSILNAVACSDYLLGDFIDFVRSSDYGDNTVIVLASDHLAMRNEALYLLSDPEEDRRDLLLINDPRVAKGREVVKPGVTLDIGATLLSFLGFDGEIGLGRDLLKEKSVLYDLEDGLETIFDFEKDIDSFWRP